MWNLRAGEEKPEFPERHIEVIRYPQGVMGHCIIRVVGMPEPLKRQFPGHLPRADQGGVMGLTFIDPPPSGQDVALKETSEDRLHMLVPVVLPAAEFLEFLYGIGLDVGQVVQDGEELDSLPEREPCPTEHGHPWEALQGCAPEFPLNRRDVVPILRIIAPALRHDTLGHDVPAREDPPGADPCSRPVEKGGDGVIRGDLDIHDPSLEERELKVPVLVHVELNDLMGEAQRTDQRLDVVLCDLRVKLIVHADGKRVEAKFRYLERHIRGVQAPGQADYAVKLLSAAFLLDEGDNPIKVGQGMKFLLGALEPSETVVTVTILVKGDSAIRLVHYTSLTYHGITHFLGGSQSPQSVGTHHHR